MLTKSELMSNYDAILHLIDIDGFQEVDQLTSKTDDLKYNACLKFKVQDTILKLLKKGLNKRVKHIVPLPINCSNNLETFNKLSFGINLNHLHAFNQIEKGPEANTVEAKEFRNFWGDLASLRRFKDGSICEAVYFEGETAQERRQIFARIIDFILSTKINLSYRLISNQIEKHIQVEKLKASFSIGTNEEACLKIKTIYDSFSQIVRNLEIPLQITSIQGCSDAFSYTDVYPPIPTTYRAGKKVTSAQKDYILLNKSANLGMVPRHVAPIECVLTLAQNNKWPDDLTAVRAFILQFYFHFADSLKNCHKLKTIVTENYVDVLYEGVVFRLRIYQPKEVILLKKITNPLGVVSYKDNESSLQLERDLNYLPTIQGALSGIHLQNSCFGPSTALVKKWIRSHLIDNFHLPDMVINLLNAHLFLKHTTNLVLPQAAFCRFLEFLVNTNFEMQMITVNFNDLLTDDQVSNVESDFLKQRGKYPPLFILTPYDNEKSAFTNMYYPRKEILARLSKLAQSALHELRDIYSNAYSAADLKQLFAANYRGYNVLIELKPLLNPRRHQNSSYEASNEIAFPKFNERECKMPVVDFNPVDEYVKVLRENYGKVALFFHDTYGGQVVGVLWIPNPTAKKGEFSQTIPGCHLDGNNIICDKEKIINNFYHLGNGLVKSVDTM